MQVERGWSSGVDRRFWRYLARRIAARPFALPGSGAVATITFDDVPESAARVGGPLLERAGLRGTFYVSPDAFGLQDRYWRVCTRGQVADLAAAGHEIACHTARHVNVQSLDRAELAVECDRSTALLSEITGTAPRNFAYPFGDLGVRQLKLLGGRFRSCRTIYEHLNTGTIDLAKVSAIGLFDSRLTPAQLEQLIRDAVAKRAWLVFYTHDVAADPTFMGTSPELLARTLELLCGHGVPCLTMDAALTHYGVPDT